MTTGLQIDRILCPTDFSTLSEKGVSYAIDLAQRYNADLKLIHVYGLPTYFAVPEGAVIPSAAYAADRSNELQRMMDSTLAKLKGRQAKMRGEIKLGVSYDEIVREADDWNADLIVMASHGYSGLTHAILGSVTERVLRLAHCPVLVVRNQAHDG